MPSILFLTAYPIEDASCRYRIHQFLPYLEKAGYECAVRSFASPVLFQALRSRGHLGVKAWEMLRCSARRLRELRDVEDFDFVVIHREAFPLFAPRFENLVIRRRRGRKVIFSFDDAIYAGHEDVSGLSHPRLYRLKHGRGYDEVTRCCTHVIAGNRILARYARRLNPSVSIVPTVVDSKLFCPRPEAKCGPVRIGWIGSRSTAPYLGMIANALGSIAVKHGRDVSFRFVGCTDYNPGIPEFESLPFSLETEVQDLQALDIGIMPLPDTEWTRGKCAFKAIQYMACGVATVASPVGITTDLIRHNSNGLLASSSDEWFAALDQLISDAALRSAISVAGRQTIETFYSTAVWGPRFVSIFDRLAQKNVEIGEGTAA